MLLCQFLWVWTCSFSWMFTIFVVVLFASGNTSAQTHEDLAWKIPHPQFPPHSYLGRGPYMYDIYKITILALPSLCLPRVYTVREVRREVSCPLRSGKVRKTWNVYGKNSTFAVQVREKMSFFIITEVFDLFCLPFKFIILQV